MISSESSSQSVEILTEEMAGALAFHPQLVARAAEEGHVAGFDGLAEGFIVHESDHEDTAGLVILDDGGNQAVELGEIESHLCIQPVSRTGCGAIKMPAGNRGGHPFIRTAKTESGQGPSHTDRVMAMGGGRHCHENGSVARRL